MFFDTARRRAVAPRVLTTLERPLQHVEYISDAELPSYVGDTFRFDIECFPNYFLAAFQSEKTKKVVCFESSPEATIDHEKLSWLLWAVQLITFNGHSYDVPLICAALQVCDEPAFLKQVSDFIILGNETRDRVEKEFDFKCWPFNHIDLIEVAPLEASLKKYAARMHAKRLQDLPYSPHEALTEHQAVRVRDYCVTDLENTGLLFAEMREQIELRRQLSKQYGQDLRSKSDAQIAEAVIVSEVRKLTGKYPHRAKFEEGDSFKYEPPSYVAYETPQFQDMLTTVRNALFVLDANGSPRCPALQEIQLVLGASYYAMGIGGLHSRESCRAVVADEEYGLCDIDVASYYPQLILNAKIKPEGMGEAFSTVYQTIVDRRLKAKAEGNKVEADSLKITANGTFGKLGSCYSAMYSPQGMIAVTLTGQLDILMLIEKLHLCEFEIVSGNTDGILVRYARRRKQELDTIAAAWAQLTGLKTEYVDYQAIYNRDVNNYIAVKLDGKTKVKGVYAEVGSTGNTRLSKDPVNLICSDAVIALLTKAKPLEQTVRECRDFTRFVSVRTVKGGGEHNGVYLGKVVRWYYACGAKGAIHYVTSGNKVAMSDNVKPCMDLPDDFPADVDFERYIREAQDILSDIGHSVPQGRLF